MNFDWFILGLIILFVAFFLYIGADTAEHRAKMSFFSGSWTPEDVHEAHQGKVGAIGFVIVGILVALVGIAMDDKSEEKEDDDWWEDDED